MAFLIARAARLFSGSLKISSITQTSQIENSPYTLKNLHWYQIKKQEEVYWDEIDLNAY
jgi:hypothetical protein